MRYLILMAAVVALTANAQATTAGSLARVSVVDRDSGVTLRTYYSHGAMRSKSAIARARGSLR